MPFNTVTSNILHKHHMLSFCFSVDNLQKAADTSAQFNKSLLNLLQVPNIFSVHSAIYHTHNGTGTGYILNLFYFLNKLSFDQIYSNIKYYDF